MSRAYDRDPYAILGIPPTATTSQVKEAYHRLARQYHPDLNKEPEANERMKDINWANDILSDPHERSLYDLWRSTSVRTMYYYPGTTSSHPNSSSPRSSTSRTPPPSTGSRTHRAPPYNPPPRTTYPKGRVTQNSQSFGCSAATIVWLIVMVLMNLGRVIQPISQSSYNNYPENMATRTAMMERLDSAIETLHASQGRSTSDISTPLPLFSILITASPTATTQRHELYDGDLRSSIVPGSWEWHHINQYFPELTTPDGLSDEVTHVIYDQLRGYQIKTRSSGEYWLHISPYDNVVSPEHIPPMTTVTPLP